MINIDEENYIQLTTTNADSVNRHLETVSTLADLSARTVAQHLPLGYVKRKYSGITDFLAKRIIFWSFPRRRSDILRYHLDCSVKEKRYVSGLFQVSKMVQVGLCVQGIVSNSTEDFYVALIFDRCFITKVTCSCREKNALWCIHAISLALHRFHCGHFIEVCIPISENVNQLNRDQLQKLLQYMLAYHHERVPALVKTIQTEILTIRSLRDTYPDVGDTTAFTGVEDIPSWFVDLTDIKDSIKMQEIERLLEDNIPEMIVANDVNGVKILRCLVEEINFLYNPVTDVMIKTWTFALAAPCVTKEDKERSCELLGMLCDKRSERYPLSLHFDQKFFCSKDSYAVCFENTPPISVDVKSLFLMALCARNLRWDDEHLKRILSNERINCNENSSEVDVHGELIWREHLPTSCVRVRALELSGRHLEAKRLAMAIARGVEDQSRRWKQAWKEIEALEDADNEEFTTKDIKHSVDGDWMNLSLVAHRVDPLEILFNSLINTSHTRRERNSGDSRCYHTAIKTLTIIFSQRLDNIQISLEMSGLFKKWMTVVSDAFQDESGCKDTTNDSPKGQIDRVAIKNVMESLLDAGFFTSCGYSESSGIPSYYGCLLMTKALRYLDTDLSAKFALSCLRNKYNIPKDPNSRRWLQNEYEDLLCFTVSAFPDHTVAEALEILLEQTSISSISNVLLKMLGDDGMHKFKDGECKIKKELVFDRFLLKLRSSLHSSRKIWGKDVLEIACNISFGQVLHLLRNWEKYILLSENIPIPFNRSRYNKRFSKEEMELFKREELELVLRFVEKENTDEESLFDFLIRYIDSSDAVNFAEAQLFKIKQKMFETGFCCLKTDPLGSVFHLLSHFVLGEDVYNMYYQALEGALQENITIQFLMSVHQLAEIFQNQSCTYKIKKLIVKAMKIPIGYDIPSETIHNH